MTEVICVVHGNAHSAMDPIAGGSYCRQCFRNTQNRAAPTLGRKDDSAKPPLEELLSFPRALGALARVVAFGTAKYGRENWRHVEPDSRYVSATLRHLLAVAGGETHDPESGEHHFAHATACVLIALEKALTKGETK